MLTVFYRYIVNPVQSLKDGDITLSAAMVSVAMSVLSLSVFAQVWFDKTGLLAIGVLIGGITLVQWVSTSANVTFFARALGHEAPALSLFKAFGMAELPMLLCLPVAVTLGQVDGIYRLLFFVGVALKIISISVVFKTHWLRAMGIYLLSFILTVAGFACVILLLIQSVD